MSLVYYYFLGHSVLYSVVLRGSLLFLFHCNKLRMSTWFPIKVCYYYYYYYYIDF